MLKVKSLYTEYASDNGTVVKAAQDVSFEVPEGKLFTLLGPSGCGKTTTLRSIAGLEPPTAGEIEVSGRAVYSSSRGIFVAPNKRNFGMVFQSYAIWPHMNVFENVAFPLEVRKLSKHDIRERVLRFPEVRVEVDALYVRDGALRTAAGVTAGLDLALTLVEEDLGRDIAKKVASQLVMFFKRPGGQLQFSRRGEANPVGRSALQENEDWPPAVTPPADGRSDVRRRFRSKSSMTSRSRRASSPARSASAISAASSLMRLS